MSLPGPVWRPGEPGGAGRGRAEGGGPGFQRRQSAGDGGAVRGLQQAEGGHLTHQGPDPPEERGAGQGPAQGHQRSALEFVHPSFNR